MPHAKDQANLPPEDQTRADNGSPAEVQDEQPAAAPSQDADPRAELERLKAENQVLREQVLRGLAELENSRKRWQRERDEERQYAHLPLLTDLLQVWDNVARAIDAAEKSPDPASLLSGFKMVAQQLTAVQEKHHCREIAALGQPFDPHLHEALLKQPSAEHPANTVCQVIRAGFKLHDRVVRPAQVIVSTGPAAGAE